MKRALAVLLVDVRDDDARSGVCETNRRGFADALPGPRDHGDLPLQFQSRTHYGCPYDCGLCPDHEQHSCLALIEINEECNLTCPVCFADATDIVGLVRYVKSEEEITFVRRSAEIG